MAKIIVSTNIFDTSEMKLYEDESGISISQFLRKIRADETDYSCCVEVYDAVTDSTVYELIADDKSLDMQVSCIVNGKEETPDYIIQDSDNVSLTILPANEETATIFTIIGGVLATAAAVILTVATFGSALPAAAVLAKVGVGLLIGGLACMLVGAVISSSLGKEESKSKQTDDSGEQSPAIKGAQNQSIVNQSYPLIVGTCSATPRVAGSFYCEYDTAQTDPSDYSPLFGTRQKAYLLYAVGYAPLYIRSVYLDQLPLTRNPNRILSGKLTYKMDSGNTHIVDDSGNAITFNGSDMEREIGQTWDNNRVSLELSQFGAHRTIYPYTVKQKSVDSAVLYCYDKAYQDVAGSNYISWQGGRFPTGMRTNTIMFSESVPYKITVGLDFQGGLFREYTDSDGNFIYDKIPMNLVIQWRPVYKYVSDNNLDSEGDADDVYDAEKNGYTRLRYYGWRNFNNVDTDGSTGLVPKITYWSHNPEGAVTYVVNKNGTEAPALKDGYYGYYRSFSTSDLGTTGGTFYRVTKQVTEDEYFNRFYPAEVEKYRKYKTEYYQEWVWLWGLMFLIPIPIFVPFTRSRQKVTHEPDDSEREAARLAALERARNAMPEQDAKWISDHKKDACIASAQRQRDENNRLYSEWKSKYDEEMRGKSSETGTAKTYREKYEGYASTASYYASAIAAINKDDDANNKYPSVAAYNHLLGAIAVDLTSKRENALNKGLTAGTSDDSNPLWNGVECFSFGKFSGGPKYYARTKADPAVTGVGSASNIEDAKNEMHFEVTATLSQEDILDLINRNPMSKRMGAVPNDGSDYDDALIGKTDVEIDGIQVRVLRLTPCYLDKTEGSGSDRRAYSYADVVKWDYLKTYCIDKQKLIDAVDSVEAETGVAKIDCGKDTFDSFDESIHKVPTWNTWDIADYYSKPLSDGDSLNMVTIGLEVEPDQIGYISNSIDSLNCDVSAITPAIKTEYIRYWHKDGDNVRYCDTYDTEGTMVPSLHPEPVGGWDWVQSDEEEFNRWAPVQLSDENGEYEGYYYSVIDGTKPWLARFFPAKIEKKNVIQPVTGTDGNLSYNDKGAVITEVIPQGNDWFDYVQREMPRYKDSAGRWVATDALIETFTDQNAVMQALGVMVGKSLGKDAYYYNSLKQDRFIRWWYTDVVTERRFLYKGAGGKYYTDSALTEEVSLYDGESVSDESVSSGAYETQYESVRYFYRDSDDTSRESATRPAFDKEEVEGVPRYYDDGWITVDRAFFNVSKPTDDGDGYWWSMRKAKSAFNMLRLKESALYTDSIDVGGDAGALKYRANMYVTSQQKLSTVIQNILVAGRAFWAYDELGRYSFVNDKPRTNPVLMITDEDCISSSNSRNFNRTLGGYHITFNDENNGFQQGELYVLRKGQSRENPTRDIVDIQLPFVTNPSQVWALGVFLLAQSITQRETWTRKLNHIGGNLSVGSLVSLQSSSLMIGTDCSGRIVQVIKGFEDGVEYIYGVVTDQMYEYKAEYEEDGRNTQGCSIFQPKATDGSKVVTLRFASRKQQEDGILVTDSDGVSVVFRNVEGQTNTLLFQRRIVVSEQRLEEQGADFGEGDMVTAYLPEAGNIVAFGKVGSITSKAIVSSLQSDDKGHVSVTLYPYLDSVYRAGDGLPVYSANMTRKPRNTSVPVDMTATRAEVQDALSNAVVSQGQIQSLIDGTNSQVTEPDSVNNVVAAAYQDRIKITWNALDNSGINGLRNTVQFYTVSVYKPGIENPTVFSTSATEYDYLFDRSTDGYPEWDELSGWYVTVTATNAYGKTSERESDAAYVDTGSYGTWKVGAVSVTRKVVDRTIILQFTAAQPSRILYGNIRYHVRVRRGAIPTFRGVKYWMYDTGSGEYYYLETLTRALDSGTHYDASWKRGTKAEYEADAPDIFESSGDSSATHEYAYSLVTQPLSADTEWRMPNLQGDPYAGSENYYVASAEEESARYVGSGETYTQTMPLYWSDGDDSNLVNTPYYFDVRAYNEAHTGGWYSGADAAADGNGGFEADALCTNIRDIVLANEDFKELYIGQLSAISANLGEISQGSLTGNDSNYWVLSNKPNARRRSDYQGAFRVGGDEQYLQVDPVIVNGEVVSYEISLKARNISFSSSGDVELGDVDLTTGTYIYDDSDPTLRLHLTAIGISIQQTSEAGDWSPAKLSEVGVIQMRSVTVNGERHRVMLISNSPEDFTVANYVAGIKAYHFTSTVLDEDGADSLSLSLDTAKLVDGGGYTVTEGGIYDGEISAVQTGKDVIVHGKGGMIINGTTVVYPDGTTETNRAAEWNALSGTDWGLTQEQADAMIWEFE